MICGKTVESWLSNSCWLIPVRCASSASTFWPSAEPSCPGGTGSFGPWPTQELTCGDTPPALGLPIRAVRPPRMLPAGAFVGTGCPGGGIGMDGVDAGAGAEPPPNILPRINAPTATAIGVARLPPGTAFFIASSKEAIVVSSTLIQIAGSLCFDHSLEPHFEDITTKTTGLRFPRPYRTFGRSARGARGGYDMWAIIAWIILGLIAGFIASKIVNKTGSGMTMDIALGVVGAIVGGYLGNLIGMGPTEHILGLWNIIL